MVTNIVKWVSAMKVYEKKNWISSFTIITQKPPEQTNIHIM